MCAPYNCRGLCAERRFDRMRGMKTNHTQYCSVLMATALASVPAFADFDLNLDLGGAPLKDIRSSTCGPVVGYAGCNGWASDAELFIARSNETAQALLDCGGYHLRMWNSNQWFSNRNHPNPAKRSQPKAAFELWKQNGIKVLFTVEQWNTREKGIKSIVDFAQFIKDNHYEDVVAGFELGNETYGGDTAFQKDLADRWCETIPRIRKVLPKVALGIPIAEYFENDPDVAQIRARLLNDPEHKVKRTKYFEAGDLNKRSAEFIEAFDKEILKKEVSHVIYHCYGAETPYSCSYYGYKRYRAFESAFPEIKGKRWWLSEIRMRSDEDNWCQRMYREALIMGHYSLMTVMQPEVDGFNLHQILAISGGLYQSDGREWQIQWCDGGHCMDVRSAYRRPRVEVGSMGVMMRILAEGLRGHPLLMHHGTSKAQDTEDTFFTSARFTDQVYVRRRAIKEGAEPEKAPKVEGEVEWIAAMAPRRNRLCLLMVNSKSEPQKIRLTAPGCTFGAPTYRTMSCPEKYLDFRAVPGEARYWTESAWEDPQQGFAYIRMEKNDGIRPKADVLRLEIAPHTVQTITFPVRCPPPAKK